MFNKVEKVFFTFLGIMLLVVLWIANIWVGIVVTALAAVITLFAVPKYTRLRILKVTCWVVLGIVGVFLLLVVFNTLAPRMYDRHTGEITYMM